MADHKFSLTDLEEKAFDDFEGEVASLIRDKMQKCIDQQFVALKTGIANGTVMAEEVLKTLGSVTVKDETPRPSPAIQVG